jgi:hypothetical protein
LRQAQVKEKLAADDGGDVDVDGDGDDDDAAAADDDDDDEDDDDDDDVHELEQGRGQVELKEDFRQEESFGLALESALTAAALPYSDAEDDSVTPSVF